MIVFNKETSWNRRGKPPVLRISRNGHIRFSVEAIRILGLKLGDTISFMIDERDCKIFYFFRDVKGMPLKHCTKGKDGVCGLQVCCRPLGQKLLDYFGFKGNKTFDITKEQCITERGKMWFVLKEKIHVPIKWRREAA